MCQRPSSKSLARNISWKLGDRILVIFLFSFFPHITKKKERKSFVCTLHNMFMHTVLFPRCDDEHGFLGKMVIFAPLSNPGRLSRSTSQTMAESGLPGHGGLCLSAGERVLWSLPSPAGVISGLTRPTGFDCGSVPDPGPWGARASGSCGSCQE